MSSDADLVLGALRARQSAINILRTLEPGGPWQGFHTLAVTTAATERISAIAADSPSASIAIPPADRWPWAGTPVLLAYEQPVTIRFLIGSEGKRSPLVWIAFDQATGMAPSH
jgi:hypothetical protein